jgi:ketosteroid isomerase-like protein
METLVALTQSGTSRRIWLSMAAAAACGALVPMRSIAGQADPRGDESAIRAARTSQNRALAAHDLDAIAKTLSIDYVGLSSTNTRVLGRDAKREDFAKQFAARPNLVFVRTPTSIIVNTAWAQAAENGQWSGEWTLAGETTRAGGVYFAKWRKEDGVWRILAETFVQTSCTGSRFCDAAPPRSQ